MLETQKTISDWAEETFGAGGSDFRRLVRVNEEMAELLRSVARDEIHVIPGELADVAIVLCRVAERSGVDLNHEANLLTNYQESHLEECVIHANFLLALLMSQRGSPRHIVDVFIALRNAANVLGLDLWKEVEKKMAINRERKWQRDGSGHGYHIKKEPVS